MISIQPYHDSMFGDVYDAFLADDDLQLAREEWSRLFRCQDTTDEQHGGYVLLDDTRIVGISGMRFSSRVIEGNHHKLCALHSWMVAPEYRGHSLMMLRPLMRLKDCSLVDFSPTAPVRRILRRLRFQDLDSALRVMLPVPGRRRPDLESSVESDQAGNSLLGADRSLFDAHRAPHIRHVFCTDQNRGCYVVYTCVTR